MKIKTPVVDYRKLRFNNLNTDEFKHLKLLIFWIFFGTMFTLEEKYFNFTYHPVHSPLDDIIPFNELFVVPYLFWFLFLIGMYTYTLLYDIKTFEKFQKYITITYSAAIICYLIYPTCQEMRPVIFERDNIFTEVASWIYMSDTNTNVCPSIHVMGACAVWSASMYAERFKKMGWQIFFGITTVLICMSTVFLKQHSIIDVFCALPICALAHYICFMRPAKKEKQILKTEKVSA